MTKQLLILLFAGNLFALAAQSQPVIYINAGSRAPWGATQALTIYQDGQCTYYRGDVNGPIRDSSIFRITTAQLESTFAKADQLNFFSLNSKYDGGAADGTGIYISINSSGKIHSVELKNTDVPAVNEFIRWINELLVPQGIKINYGQPASK